METKEHRVKSIDSLIDEPECPSSDVLRSETQSASAEILRELRKKIAVRAFRSELGSSELQKLTARAVSESSRIWLDIYIDHSIESLGPRPSRWRRGARKAWEQKRSALVADIVGGWRKHMPHGESSLRSAWERVTADVGYHVQQMRSLRGELP